MSKRSSFLVQPLVALLYARTEPLSIVEDRLRSRWGPVQYKSDPVPFDVTDYYRDEMGSGLERSIWSFEHQMDASKLVERKQQTLEVEDELSEGGDRVVNIDPGYIDPAKLVLASIKENGQKIYLRDGIFADMILFYEKGDWEPLPWTFPDFRSGRYDDDLTRIRTDWRRKR